MRPVNGRVNFFPEAIGTISPETMLERLKRAEGAAGREAGAGTDSREDGGRIHFRNIRLGRLTGSQ